MRLVIRSAERAPLWHDLLPGKVIALLWQKRSLIKQLIRREVVGRYRGSMLGTLWAVLLPLIGVIVYTIVFGFIFKQRWPGMETASVSYALVLWAGLALYQAFAEMVQRATSIIQSQPNLVKKVVFPLEVLPVMLVGTSLIPLGLSMLVVTLGLTISQGQMPHLGWLFFAMVCFILWLQGIAWLLASMGTYLRDLSPMVQGVLPLCMFLTPIFYPMTAIPEAVRGWFWINPLTTVVETIRSALLATPLPPTLALLALAITALVTWQLGACVFARLRSEMADVV
jgi:lipopolysaccharide transport system permease protein